LCSRTCFRRYRARRAPFSCFALPDAFSASPRGSGPVFKFCAPGRFFVVTERVGHRFQVLRSRTRFRRHRERRGPLTSWALRNAFSALPCAWGTVFTFCATERVFGVTERVGHRLNVLRSGTRFRRDRARRALSSRFALLDTFSALPRASGTVFTFCTPERVFGVTERVGPCFQVLCSRTRFQSYRASRFSF